MKKSNTLAKEQNYDNLVDSIPYLLAGFEGRTSGKKINSITIQQAGISGYRVIVRAVGVDSEGHTIHLVGFTIGSGAGESLLLTEGAYQANKIQWKVDQYAKDLSRNGSSKDGRRELVLTD